MNEVESRPGGINLAAAILCLLICFGAICLIGAVGALFMTRNPVVPKVATVRIILSVFDLALLLFLLWCAATVVGLFKLRGWARLSIIAIGVIDFVVFALFSVLMMVAKRAPMVVGLDEHPNPAMPFPVGALLLALAVIYGAIALVGLWWIVYFNLREVRLTFRNAKTGQLPTPPAV